MHLSGRTALVTGSSRGIGKAIALRLARDGAQLIVHARSSASAERVVAEIVAAGGRAATVVGDLAEDGVATRVVRDAFRVHGGLDILVLNAGGGRGTKVIDLDERSIDQALNINLRASMLATAEFARRTESPYGRIVYVSALLATHPAPGVGATAAAKAGGEAFMRTAAQELGERAITCNAIAPGCTRTDALIGQRWPDRVVEWTALRRLGEPEDIADIVAFLVSDEARWLTGITVPASGGLITTAANIATRR